MVAGSRKAPIFSYRISPKSILKKESAETIVAQLTTWCGLRYRVQENRLDFGYQFGSKITHMEFTECIKSYSNV